VLISAVDRFVKTVLVSLHPQVRQRVGDMIVVIDPGKRSRERLRWVSSIRCPTRNRHVCLQYIGPGSTRGGSIQPLALGSQGSIE